jgi:ubiquinol-cytochrome c reductase cytochrome b subunit
MMTLTYTPSPERAYQSIVEITERQRLGWFIRGLHYWSAGMMVVMVFFHLFRQILVGGYKSPREGTWYIGVLLLVCVFIMAFTGYVLRWDERAIYALLVSLHMFSYVPLIGDWLVMFVQGGETLNPFTLPRIFSVHVIFIPVAIAMLAGFHLYLVMLHGVTSDVEKKIPVEDAEHQKELYEKQKKSEIYGETFHPHTTSKSGTMAILVFLLVALLAFLFGPTPLMPEANRTAEAFPAEEWWFWWVSGLIALLPPWLAPIVIVGLPIGGLLVLLALPIIDRSPNRGIKRRPIAVLAVVLTVIGLLYLTDVRRRSMWTAWPNVEPPALPFGVTLPPEAEQGRVLFAQHGCNTCHAIAGVGWRFGPDLARLPVLMSREEMRAYILRPPPGIPMPGYEGRISDEELERILDFVHAAQTFPRQ